MEKKEEKSYAVLGMGRYGRKIAETIAKTGVDVLVADSDYDLINEYSSIFTYAVSLDLNNEKALRDLGLNQIDIAIVDMKNNLEATIMCIMIAKEEGVSKVIATAGTEMAEQILKKVGADEVVIPEHDAAFRMAKNLISEDFIEYFDLGNNLCVVKVRPRNEWIGKSLRQLKLPERYDFKVVGIENEDGIQTEFSKDDIIIKDKIMVLIIKKESIYDFV